VNSSDIQQTRRAHPAGPGLTLVTGAGGGIGGEIVASLLDDGHTVSATDCGGLDELLARSREEPRLVVSILDVTDDRALRRHVEDLEAVHGPLQNLVTAAGVQRTGASQDYPLAEWERVIRINLTGTWLPIQATLPSFLREGFGRIVTISSEIGLSGASHYAAYAASKGGVIALTKSLAREFAPAGILVNSVAPGPVETGIFLGERGHNQEWLDANVPLGRFGTPPDIAPTVSFLLSGRADYYTGQVLSPNGGVVI
jgi:NAD(P)-dependent dehydrogenase (short-subunit alcohol dehydrogenase family)